MSNLVSLPQLRPVNCQLPMSWYFDAEIFAREKQLLFDAGANYVGHELMVPNVGDYRSLEWKDHAKLLGAPLFAQNPCVKLHSSPLTRWNGLLFTGPRDARRDLADFGCSEDFDFSGYVLDRVETTDYATNWKTFVEVYHVDFLHPGLGNFADCGNFHVRYGERNSVQVMAAKNGLSAPGTPVYRKWQEACLRQLRGKTPKYGALWATYFPGLTLEWYPSVLIVSNLIPRSPGLTTNVVEFYYPKEIVHFEREFIEAQQAAYNETAKEDDEICLRLDRGRRALWEQGLDDAGPYQSPMEDTMVHFHEWLRRGLEGK